MNKQRAKEAIAKARKGLWSSFPMLLGVVLLVSLAGALVPASTYGALFKGDFLLDSLIGSGLGSILAGNPLTSYVLGGELLAQGVSLFAVTAFLVAWVTVGIVQFPAESLLLGRRFALVRNSTAFLLSLVAAGITVAVVGLL